MERRKKVVKYNIYTKVVVDAVIDYYKENFDIQLIDTNVYLMEPHDVLRIYLEWEGIIGYTWIIEDILIDHKIEEYEESIYDKEQSSK